MFNITTDAVFVGMIDKFEVWEPSAYEADQAALEAWDEEEDD